MKPDFVSENKPLVKPSGRWAISVAVIAALVLGGAAIQYAVRFQSSSTPASNSAASATPNAVAALGHLRPEGEVVHISSPTVLNGMGTNRVAKLLVKEGDKVKAGQVIAILDNHQTLKAALKLAQEEVNVAQSNLAKVKAGAKAGELEAQRATIANLQADLQGQLAAQNQAIARLKAEFSNREREYQRYLQLLQNGAVSASDLDGKQLAMKSAQEQLDEAQANRDRIEATFEQQIRTAQATLNQIAEVRPTDVQAAQAEVNRAIASVRQAQAELDLSYIRAPNDGQVLKIRTRPGEVVTEKGIVALGQTEQMNVIAEVYELDVGKVRVGQKARITSNVFPGELYGTVAEVGLQIDPQGILTTDPTADVDRRVVEVKIRLNAADSQKVSVFTNLQVNVVIDITS